MIRVKVLEANKIIELEDEEIIVKNLLERLGLRQSECIVLRNGVVVTEEDAVRSGDEVVVYTVKSGG
ncbi:MAG: MoaD/ThiS family protein [Thermosphaera sp.]|jgi:sulfur carrier protein ThiS|nr:MoaD/ThiS family protein [Thermosphaera sp.]